MARPGWERRSSGPHRKNWPAPLRDAQRDDASSAAKKRGDGLERRSPTGIARERETCADDTAPCQRECPILSQHRMPRSLSAAPPRGRTLSCPAGCPGGPDHARLSPLGARTATAAHRDDASSAAKKRGDGLERRSPTGIARERETCADDTAPCQRECPIVSQHRMPRSLSAASPRSRTLSCPAGCPGGPDHARLFPAGGRHRCATRTEMTHRQPRRSAGTAWSAGLRPASRGSAKPARMTLHHASVSVPSSPSTGCLDRCPLPLPAAAPFHARRGVLEDPIVSVSPAGGPHRYRRAAQPRSR